MNIINVILSFMQVILGSGSFAAFLNESLQASIGLMFALFFVAFIQKVSNPHKT